MVVHGCLWLFIDAMVALAAMVVHCRHGCSLMPWLPWLLMVVDDRSWLPWLSCRSCPFVVAMDVCGCHGRSGRSWLFMAVYGCHGCSLPPWLPWLLMSFMPVRGCNGWSWLSHSFLAVPNISSYFSPCAALVDTLLSIFRHGTIYHHTVWDHRLSQG